MDLTELIKTYNPEMWAPFIFGGILFFLYGIIQLIKLNSELIREHNILDVEYVNPGYFIYTYLFSYVNFIIKIITSMFVLFLLILVIRIAYGVIINIFTTLKSDGSEGTEVSEGVVETGKSSSINPIVETIKANLMWIGGFVLNMYFGIIYLVLIPSFLLIVLFVLSKFYDHAGIKVERRKTDIMNTQHNYMVLFMTLLFVIGFVYSIYLWYYKAQLETEMVNPAAYTAMLDQF